MSTPRKVEPAVKEYVRSHGFSPTQWYEMRTPPPKKIVVVGEIQQIEYTTRKDFEGEETFIFQHDFEGAKKPYLAKEGERCFVIGGGYTVTPHGIEDDASDRRDLPRRDAFKMRIATPRVVTGMGDMYSLTIKTPQGRVEVVRWSKSNKAVLAYNFGGKTKQLYILPTNNSKRGKL
jgi:hypothetical protein